MAVESHDDIAVSTHAASHWDERTSSASVAPETAWREGWPVRGVPQTTFKHAEMRYHPDEHVVLVRRMASLVTVIDLSDADSRQWRAVRRHVEKQFAGVFTEGLE